MKLSQTLQLTAFSLLLAMFAVGCGDGIETDGDPKGGGTAETSADPEKLVIAFQKQTDAEKIIPTAEKVAEFLSAEIGIPVEFQVPLDYNMTIEALIGNTAHIAYLDSYNYLKAKKESPVEIVAAELRADASGNMNPYYESIFLVRKDGDIKSYNDFTENHEKYKFAITNYNSTSGYLMPMRRFVKDGILQPGDEITSAFDEVVVGGNYTGAIQAVVGGQAHICAVSFYSFEGDRADNYTTAEEREQLMVLERNPSVPTHLIAVRSDLSDELKQKIQDALMKFSDEQPKMLADVYGAKKLTRIDSDDHVEATVEALEAIGKSVEQFLEDKKKK